MPNTEVYEVTCSECETETTVAVTRWPATRTDPADGETSPEECPKCGKPFNDTDNWAESEPPERYDRHEDDPDYWEAQYERRYYR